MDGGSGDSPASLGHPHTDRMYHDDTFETPANEARTVTFTAVAPEGTGSRALWNDATSGKLGFTWEPETDNKIDLYWVGANSLSQNATLSGHSGASVTVTGTAPEGATQVVALFPANTIQVGDGEMYRTLPTELTQVGASTAHLRDYMYLNGTLAIDKVTDGTATMQLAHGCAVLRFNVKNSGADAVRVTRVEMLAASGKTGVNTRAAITAANAENGTLTYSEPQNIAVAVQHATDDTKGYTLAAEGGSLAVYAHCFPTAIEDEQFQFCITVTDENGDNERTYITKEAFSANGITTTDDTDTEKKMFKAGYYYTFHLDIASDTRFEELPDCTIQTDGDGNVTGYIVNTYTGLQAWRAAVMNEDGTMKDINLTLGRDITMPEVAEDGNNWTPVGGAHVANVGHQYYTGTIDGAGHTISGLVINSSNSGGDGFIGMMQGGSIKNLKLADVRVTGGSLTGALVGDAVNTSISGCEVTGGTVKGSTTGGLVGWFSGTEYSITDCINRAAVTASGQRVGGIVGYAISDTISGCENYGAVNSTFENASSYAGGIAGYVGSVTLKDCINHASSITGTYAGYMAGKADSSTEFSDCTNQSGNTSLEAYGYMDEM